MFLKKTMKVYFFLICEKHLIEFDEYMGGGGAGAGANGPRNCTAQYTIQLFARKNSPPG